MSTPPPDTRPPAITEAQLERIIHAMQQRGATVNVTDPRVTAVQAWILGLVGSGVVGAAIWGANSLSELTTTVTIAIARQQEQGKVQDDHEARLRSLERRP
jgi:hypothetical protein